MLKMSAAGAYPAGAADCGALDMSGNVYEWTHTLYEKYPYNITDGRENPLAEGKRALRGGACSNLGWYARVSYRSNDHPANFSFLYSFRLVVAPVFPSF